MMSARYQLTIRLPFEAMDDVEARRTAQDVLREFGVLPHFDREAHLKLQAVNNDRPPRKVDLIAGGG